MTTGLPTKYKITFPVESKVTWRYKGKVTDSIEVEENKPNYLFAVFVDANDEDSAFTRASDEVTTYLNAAYIILNTPARVILNSPVLCYEQNQDQDNWELKEDRTAFKVSFQATPKGQEALLPSIEKAVSVATKSDNKYLRLAMDFCSRHIWEAYRENKFVDLFIAFEALYSDSNTELTMRLANRVATLLGDYQAGRIEIADRMSDLYAKRSQLMHGSAKVKIEEADIKDALDYLKDSMRLFIKLASRYTKQEILGLIDSAVLDAKNHAKLIEESKK